MKEIFLLAGLIKGIFCTAFYYRRKIRRKVGELSDEIYHLEKRNYRMNMRQDEFSPLEDDIYKLFLQVVEEREQNKELYQIQSRNLEDIAHQIKTPITAMLFEVENGEQDGGIDVENLKKQLSRLNDLTNALLKLSQLEAHLFQMKEQSCMLEEIVEYALDILKGDIEQNKVEIIGSSLEKVIIGDYYWISEAIINLLKNAISVSKGKRIWISSRENPLYTELSIRDEGGGIDPKEQKKIFQRFYKDPDSKGFGIGLSMAKSIVEANHGQIKVENVEEGAQFLIKFYKVT